MFGVSKHFPIKLQLLFLRVMPLEYALYRQITIPRVNICYLILCFIGLFVIYISHRGHLFLKILYYMDCFLV